MTIKTLVFDFGNVIGFFSHRRTSERLALHCDIPANELHAQIFNGHFEDGLDSGRISTAELLTHVRQTFRPRCSDEELIATFGDIFWPNQDVCDLIPLLKRRYRLLLGSNTNELHTRQFRRQFGETLRHFDSLVFSYEIGACKPETAFFEHCQRLIDCERDECLFIDDMPANIAGAQAFGWRGIVYKDIADLRTRLADFGIREGVRG